MAYYLGPGLMARQRIQPPGLHRPSGHTHVVVTRGERTAYIAGQVAIDAQGTYVGVGDFAAQTRQVFENLSAALAGVGASFADVAKLTIYIVDYRMAEHGPALQEIYTEYTREHPPATTVLGVQALATPDLLIEIDAIAVLD